MAGSDSDSEYESGAPGLSTEKKSRTEIVHKKCVTTYSRQDFKPNETKSIDNDESRRSSPLQIIGDIMNEHDNKLEVDDDNPTIDHLRSRKILGARLSKAPKTSAERGREFRARKALRKQQIKQQRASNTIVEIPEDIRSTGPSEGSQVSSPSGMRKIDKKARSAEATRRWRERKRGLSGSSKKQPKTAAQRMREYRERKKKKNECV